MSRGTDSEFNDDYTQPVVFAALEFDGGTVRVHTGIGPLDIGGDTYEGVGDFGRIDPIEEGTEVSPYSLGMSLSGLDSTLMDEAMNQDFWLRNVTIYAGTLDGSGALNATPKEIWSGFMDDMPVSLGGNNEVRVLCESAMAIFDQSNDKRYTDAQLQADYSGDLLLEYLDQMQDAKVVWNGRETVRFGGGGGVNLPPGPRDRTFPLP